MSRTLFVVVGAGASYDASSSWDGAFQLRPPLVKGLFDRTHENILATYPLAQSAAPEIRDVLERKSGGKAISLESHLRKMYRDSTDPYDVRRFYSIALYLQDLLWQVSKASVHFDNTDRLVAALLRRFEHVCFITLNYDTILDQALSKLDPLRGLSDYISHSRWSIIKLHGSVDWGYAPTAKVDVDHPSADLKDLLSPTIRKGYSSLGGISNKEIPRFARSGGKEIKLFPALTVPVGEEDEIVCPEKHQLFLRERLQAEEELDVLILGYSAYDRTVIQKLGDSEKRIRTLMVVNQNQTGARKVVDRLRQLLPQALNGTRVTMDRQPFGQWCREGLHGYVSSFLNF